MGSKLTIFLEFTIITAFITDMIKVFEDPQTVIKAIHCRIQECSNIKKHVIFYIIVQGLVLKSENLVQQIIKEKKQM